MKVFTVTFLIKNYGSLLQTYALQTCLKEFGAEPVIIVQKYNGKRSRILTLLSILKPVKHYSLIQRIKKHIHVRKYSEKNKKLEEFRKQNISVIQISDKESFLHMIADNDIFLAGSDQIWSMAQSPLSPWYTLQWTKNVKNKRYSYAASIGLSALSQDQILSYSNNLSSFEIISLREKHAISLLTPLFPNRVRQDLDPTLLYDASFWRIIESKRLIDEPYIFVYMLRPDKNVIKLARRVAKDLKCKILYTGLLADNYRGVTTICNAGIEDFLSYIDNAEAVIVNSFHGTVFSVLFEKPFLSVKVASTSSRVESFLSMVGLMSQYVENVNQDYSLSVNYTNVRQVLEKERQKSLNYLQSICQRG